MDGESPLLIALVASAMFHIAAWLWFERGHVDRSKTPPIKSEAAFEIAKAAALGLVKRRVRFALVPKVIVFAALIVPLTLYFTERGLGRRAIFLAVPCALVWIASVVRLVFARFLVRHSYVGLPPEVTPEQYQVLVEDQLYLAIPGDFGKYVRSLRPWMVAIHFTWLFGLSVLVLFALG
jgi:hypothetical protein